MGSEFGALTVSLDGLLGSDPGSKRKLCGSEYFKQLERPAREDPDSWKVFSSNIGSSKVSKLSDGCFSVNTPNLSLQQMLCFSTSSASSHSNCAGVATGGGSMSGGNLPGTALGGGIGPFTPSQRMELEHQALIYKYIHACVPVPSNLLIPIQKAFESAGFFGYGSGILRPNTLGWGGFQLRFSNNSDPEPGRCRRTDGKKWRCSKDAVADQKYCERHMNRGRHCSRKPVEELNTGHPVSGGQTTTTTTTSTGTANNNLGLKVNSVVPRNGAPNNICSNFQSGLLSLSSDPYENRFSLDKDSWYAKIHSSSSGFSITPLSTDIKSKAALIPDSSSERTSSLLNSNQNLGTLKDLTDREAVMNHSCRQFMNAWPGMNFQSPDATRLPISVSVASNDNKVRSSLPLRTGLELDQVQMNLGVGGGSGYDGDQVHKQTMNWIPISWGTSMGGPLGEVLHNANNSSSSTDCKNRSVLNLMTEGWDSSSSSSLGSSPTGVLQKTTFGSNSNSSAGSSPQAEENLLKPPMSGEA